MNKLNKILASLILVVSVAAHSSEITVPYNIKCIDFADKIAADNKLPTKDSFWEYEYTEASLYSSSLQQRRTYTLHNGTTVSFICLRNNNLKIEPSNYFTVNK